VRPCLKKLSDVPIAERLESSRQRQDLRNDVGRGHLRGSGDEQMDLSTRIDSRRSIVFGIT
jgi:hypothetical protein